MIRKYSAYLIILFLLSFTGCESLSLEEKSEEYPVLIEKVDSEVLKSLNEQYHQNNNGLICSPLNEYALTGYSRALFPNDVNPCLSRTELKKEVQFDNSFLEAAKQSLLKNSEFTGVIEIEELVASEIIPLEGCTICEGPDINNVPLQWKLQFAAQKINGIEVSSTEIVVYLDANGVNRIWGNWYKPVDPGFIEFGSNQAQEVVIGLKLRFANERNQIFEQVITKEHIVGDPELRFSTINVDEGLEIHKNWEISLLQENSERIRWKVFISTVTGELLDITLL